VKAVAVYPGKKTFQVIADHPEPRIESSGQIKLRMLEVGICGTDKDIVSHFTTKRCSSFCFRLPQQIEVERN
jgi:threonine dehydrogenase-like Zn-dependent dehydrogenase